MLAYVCVFYACSMSVHPLGGTLYQSLLIFLYESEAAVPRVGFWL